MPEFPTLAFVPVDRLLIHEQHDEQRTRPLVLRIRSAGVWLNPPIVCPLEDGSGRYVVLDGANRTMALQAMGIPHALVQIVEAHDPGLKLQTWNHVVWELNPQRFLQGIQAIPGLECRLEQSPPSLPQLTGDCNLALIKTPADQTYTLCTEATELPQRVALLSALVASYAGRARLDRTNIFHIAPLVEIYPALSGLVIFPPFDLPSLLQLAGEGVLLPSGITRFVISPRALHLNYPLEELAAPTSLEEKNRRLHKWIQERLAQKNVRYYAEATVLFDE